jgi:hypothetical protein
VAQNAIDLALVSDVADACGVTADATVQRVLTAASRAVARYCNRTFEKGAAIVEAVAGYGGPRLIVARAPLLSVTSIAELGATVDPTFYEIESAEAGIIARKVAYGSWARTQRLDGRISLSVGRAVPETGDLGITVTYDGGYQTPGQVALAGSGTSTVPEDLQEAAIITAASLYKGRGRDQDVASEAIGDWSVSYFDQRAAAALPPLALAMLDPYRRLVI